MRNGSMQYTKYTFDKSGFLGANVSLSVPKHPMS